MLQQRADGMFHEQNQDKAQQDEEAFSIPLLAQSDKSQETAGGSAEDPATACSSLLAKAWKVVKSHGILLRAVMFLVVFMVGLLCGIAQRPAVERGVLRPSVNASLDVPTNRAKESR